jgi:replicative DNA helicase
VLNLLLKSKLILRQNVSKVKVEYFTGNERKFIYDCIQRIFKSSKGLLTKTLIDYEIHSRIDDKERHFYEAEWTLIVGMNVVEEIEVLLERLHKAEIGRQLTNVAENMVNLLEKGDIDDALKQLRNTAAKISTHREVKPVIELTDYHSRLELIIDKRLHPEKYLGIKTGFRSFDLRTGGLFPGEMTLVSGITGLGKSTLLKQIETGIALGNVKKNVLHVCNEEHLLQVQTKFDAQITRIPYNDFKQATITDEDLDRWKQAMEVDLKKPNLGRIFIKEVPAFTDVLLMEESLHELENLNVHVDVVIIDHLPHVRPIEKAWGEYDEQGKAAADCKELARSFNLSVVVATQAATIVEEKQTKGRRAGKLDVYGSKEQVHVANTSLVITQTGVDETQQDREEWERDALWLCDIKKNRDGPTFSFKLKHHVRFGFVEETHDKLAPHVKAALDDAVKEAEEAKKSEKPQESVPVVSEKSLSPEAEFAGETPPATDSSPAAVELASEVAQEPSALEVPVATENLNMETIGASIVARMRKKQAGG